MAGHGRGLRGRRPREGARPRGLTRSRGGLGDADLLEYEPEDGVFDLVAILYLQVPHDELDVVLRRAATAVARGGTLLVLGHDTTNLRDGHGGPKDVSVLFTPEGNLRRLARRSRGRASGEGPVPGLARGRPRGDRDRRLRPRPAAHRAFLGRRRRPSPAHLDGTRGPERAVRLAPALHALRSRSRPSSDPTVSSCRARPHRARHPTRGHGSRSAP